MAQIERSNQSKLRIAVVVPKYGLVGGGERFVSELTERLARYSHLEIHVFANAWYAASDAVTFHKVPNVPFPRFLRPLCFAMFARRMIDREDFDVVHSHDRILSADVYSLHFVPHRGWIRDIRRKRPSLFDRTIIAIERRVMQSGASSWFLPVSSIGEDAFRDEYGILPGRWEIMHPGVEVARFASPARGTCREEVRSRYDIGPNDLLVLFVGMNFEVKGLGTVIKAVSKAQAALPATAVRLLVVGRGNIKKYQAFAQALGIPGSVVFAGQVDRNLERYYRAADMFAMLSTFDTFGLVVLEAMASELPVIVTSHVGAKDLVEDGVNGFVLDDEQDADIAADRIVRLADAQLREAMGRAALQTAIRNDWEKLAEVVNHIYQSSHESKYAHSGSGSPSSR